MSPGRVVLFSEQDSRPRSLSSSNRGRGVGVEDDNTIGGTCHRYGAAARVELARAHFTECRITASFDGVISKVHVCAGDLAGCLQ